MSALSCTLAKINFSYCLLIHWSPSLDIIYLCIYLFYTIAIILLFLSFILVSSVTVCLYFFFYPPFYILFLSYSPPLPSFRSLNYAFLFSCYCDYFHFFPFNLLLSSSSFRISSQSSLALIIFCFIFPIIRTYFSLPPFFYFVYLWLIFMSKSFLVNLFQHCTNKCSWDKLKREEKQY